MYNISRKNTLGIHLRRFKKEFPRAGDYDFFPLTWLYPTDFFDIHEYYQQKCQSQGKKQPNQPHVASAASNPGQGTTNLV
jgi:hypothetical protein